MRSGGPRHARTHGQRRESRQRHRQRSITMRQRKGPVSVPEPPTHTHTGAWLQCKCLSQCQVPTPVHVPRPRPNATACPSARFPPRCLCHAPVPMPVPVPVPDPHPSASATSQCQPAPVPSPGKQCGWACPHSTGPLTPAQQPMPLRGQTAGSPQDHHTDSSLTHRSPTAAGDSTVPPTCSMARAVQLPGTCRSDLSQPRNPTWHYARLLGVF